MVACCRLREGAQPQTPLLPLPLLRPCLPAGALLLPCPAALEDRVVAVAAGVAAWPPWGPKTPAGVEEAGEVEEEAGPVLPEPPPASSSPCLLPRVQAQPRMPHARGQHRCHCHRPLLVALQHTPLVVLLLLLLRLVLVLQALLLLVVGVGGAAAGLCPHN